MTDQRADQALEDRAVDTLLQCAAEWSGFQPEGVAREAVRRALKREIAGGASIHDVLRRAAVSEPALVRALRSAVGVRETFFFRGPEQFELIAAHALNLAHSGVVRAWSAGCATGEETWSLAATLSASLAGGDAARIAVLGSDIHEPGLETARAGLYRSASIRPSGPLHYPVLTSINKTSFEVLEPLRRMTSFVTHDLRDPPPGQFEVIFCRNVLIYFRRPQVLTIVEQLVAGLAPGGFLVFGTMDVDAADLRGMVRIGKPELMTFSNARQPRRRPTTRQVAAPRRPRSPTLPPEAITLHRNALMWIEVGGRGGAEKVLVDLNRRFPDYLPGILERALVHVRKGEHVTAVEWMSEVLRRAEVLPPDQKVPGLESLPASFYRDTARAYLERAVAAKDKKK